MDEQQPHDPFRPMAKLLTDWLAGARLREALHLVHLVRAELARRGVAFLWSIRQSDPQTPAPEAHDGPCPIAERRAGV